MKSNDVILRKSNLTTHHSPIIPDINLSSCLTIVGHTVKNFRFDNGRLSIEFEDSEKLQQDILDYYNHKLRVDPLDFGQALRNFKSMARTHEGERVRDY